MQQSNIKRINNQRKYQLIKSKILLLLQLTLCKEVHF
jgi:hypothetical protein